MCFALLICDIILRIAIIEKKVAVQWKKEAEEPNAPRETPSRANEVSPDDGTAREKITPTEEVNQQHAPLKSSKLPPILLLLKSRRLLVALFGCVIQAIILTAFDTVLPLRLKEIFGWSSTGLGLIFLAIVIPTLASPYIGVLSERYGPRWFVTAGFLLTCPLMICLRFVDHYDIRQIVLLCAILAIIGITMSLILVPYMTEITYVVVAKETKHPGIFGPNGAYAQAYALFNMAYAAGCMIGPIWSGFVSERAGWGTMAWSLGLLSAVTTIPAAIWTGGYIKGKKNEDSVDDTVENIPPV